MSDQMCLIKGCPFRAYAPSGTRALCKEHFLDFATWRRKKGAGMFHRYAGMTMDERDEILAEWSQTIKVER